MAVLQIRHSENSSILEEIKKEIAKILKIRRSQHKKKKKSIYVN